MIPQKLEELARDLKQRRLLGERPPVLLLGAGASVEAGVGAMTDLFAFVGCADFPAFVKYVEPRTAAERYRLLSQFLQTRRPDQVTGGYRALATMCEEGYFDLVLTTNLDPLLDDALAAARLWRKDFLLLVNGIVREDRLRVLLNAATPRLKVLKLHGDLFLRFMAWTPQEMDAYLSSIATELGEALTGRDLLVVGHGLRDARILELTRRITEKAGVVWYTHPSSEPEPLRDLVTVRAVVDSRCVFEKLFPTLLLIVEPERLKAIEALPADFIRIPPIWGEPTLPREAVMPKGRPRGEEPLPAAKREYAFVEGGNSIEQEDVAQLLLDARLIDENAVVQARQEQSNAGGSLSANLVKTGAISEEGMLEFLSRHYSVPSIDLRCLESDPTVTRLLPGDVARRFLALPVATNGRKLILAIANPANIFAIDDIKFITGHEVEAHVATATAVKDAIDRAYDSADRTPDETAWSGEDLSVVEQQGIETTTAPAGADRALLTPSIVDALRVLFSSELRAQTLDDLLAAVVGISDDQGQSNATGFVLLNPPCILCDRYPFEALVGKSPLIVSNSRGDKFAAQVVQNFDDRPFGPLQLEIPVGLRMPGLEVDPTPVRRDDRMRAVVAAGDRIGISSGPVTDGVARSLTIESVGEVPGLVRLSMAVRPGSSGAPVVDASFRVRGFIVAGNADLDEPDSWMDPASRWHPLLKPSGTKENEP